MRKRKVQRVPLIDQCRAGGVDFIAACDQVRNPRIRRVLICQQRGNAILEFNDAGGSGFKFRRLLIARRGQCVDDGLPFSKLRVAVDQRGVQGPQPVFQRGVFLLLHAQRGSEFRQFRRQHVQLVRLP